MEDKLSWGAASKAKGWDGLNNAAINVFNSHVINSFVREMLQNSNDARDSSLPVDTATGKRPPLQISINYRRFRDDQCPDFNGFLRIFTLMKSAEPNKAHIEFFRNGEKALGNRNSIKVFVYEDYNTIGLEGADDDATKSFNACVLSEGTSVKQADTAGGSYGIGKNAIFSFSKLRTVFYSSLNKRGEYIFQGIAKLASYQDKNSKTFESRVFCGIGDELKSVRDFSRVPKTLQEVFKRTRPGLSQFALCPTDNPNWVQEFAKAILRNYWLLVHDNDLIVELKHDDELQLTIDKNNLNALLKRFFEPENYEPDKDLEPSGNPFEFYQTFIHGQVVESSIQLIGKVKFYFRELETNKSNRVAYVRNGMVIYSKPAWGFGSINYCGVFICESDEGNKILRLMEPPTHDSFDPERLVDKTDRYNAADGDLILNNIKSLVNSSLQQISDKYKQPIEDIPWLDELLSSLSGAAANGNGSRTNEAANDETPERINARLHKTLVFNSLRKDVIINSETGDIDGTGGGRSGGTGGGPGMEVGKNGGGIGGGVTGGRDSKKTKIKSRIFLSNSSFGNRSNEYKVFLNSEKEIEGTDIFLTQKGDSGSIVTFELIDVKDSSGKTVSFSKAVNKAGEVTAFRLQSISAPSELTMIIKEPYKSSFKLSTKYNQYV